MNDENDIQTIKLDKQFRIIEDNLVHVNYESLEKKETIMKNNKIVTVKATYSTKLMVRPK
ncbi:hypothetical protein QFZ37_002015 [Chryseobacterium ginsenosidimutans]|uniref:hypothetical protein n=1 Tax=Chryseobacterium ginsenosidimutans TaxID=687846 RepID=UPI00278A6114|nr:hypothetical protein [Chryseobacterium ginsenosidimutans]MDQ0593646.1 hypothetical protein [Chryseobacterium ginsenosidimutans]